MASSDLPPAPGVGAFPALRIARALAFVLAFATPVAITAPNANEEDPSPEAIRASFAIEDGFRIELVAAEPLIRDPIDLAFDEVGRLWVVEMEDYPDGPAPGEPPRGRVRFLSDDDRDGRYDSSTVFRDHLAWPTGIAPWRGGVIVSTAKEVLWLGDSDGDGHSDLERRLAEGFDAKNPQLLPNNPTWSIDNGLYLANGLRASAVRIPGAAPGDEPRTLDFRARDLRLDPLTGAITVVSGGGQFGLAFDAAGERFGVDNRHPVRHVVVETSRPMSGRQALTVSAVNPDVPLGGQPVRVYPRSRNWTTSNLHAGTFTAACGIQLWLGEKAGPAHGDVFVCEPTGNLIWRAKLERRGATFVARRTLAEREHLSSTSEWFRPVNLTEGPDGALYIADMARPEIEHPEFLPLELRDHPRLREGKDRGRIWRIVATTRERNESPTEEASIAEPASIGTTVRAAGGDASRGSGQLGTRAPLDWCDALSSPSSFQRMTAQRLIVERGERAVIPRLEEIATRGTDPIGRLHAFWALDGLDALDAPAIIRALDDPHPPVRRAAVRLADRTSSSRELLMSTLAHRIAREEDGSVALELALRLPGPIDETASASASFGSLASAVARAAVRFAFDPWITEALASGSAPFSARVIAELPSAVLSQDETKRPSEAHLRALALRFGRALRFDRDSPRSEHAGIFAPLLRDAEDTPSTGASTAESAIARDLALAAFAGSTAALRGATDKTDAEDVFARLGIPRDQLAQVARSIIDQAISGELPGDLAPHAIAPLALLDAADRADAISRALRDGPAQEILLALVDESRSLPGEVRAELLLARWHRHAPPVRRRVLDALVRDATSAARLLDAVALERIPATDIEPAARDALRRISDDTIRRRVAALLPPPPARDETIARFRPALELAGERARGRAIFRERCGSCHRVANEGTADIGPDISDTREKTPEALLIAILDPDRAIDASYLGYTVITTDGDVESAMIRSATETHVELVAAGGARLTIPRERIAEIRATGSSFMPTGLEEGLDPQDVADLIAFLKTWRFE